MRVPMLSTRSFGFVLFLIAGTVGCAQPGSREAGALTAPTSLAGADAAPGASYDGSGSWHFHVDITSRDPSVEDGSVEGDITFTQDLDGNLHATVLDSEEDPRPTVITLIRKGSGRKLSYQMSILEEHTDCNEDLSGHAQIDISSNTLEARLTGTAEGCARVTYEVSATKNP